MAGSIQLGVYWYVVALKVGNSWWVGNLCQLSAEVLAVGLEEQRNGTFAWRVNSRRAIGVLLGKRSLDMQLCTFQV